MSFKEYCYNQLDNIYFQKLINSTYELDFEEYKNSIKEIRNKKNKQFIISYLFHLFALDKDKYNEIILFTIEYYKIKYIGCDYTAFNMPSLNANVIFNCYNRNISDYNYSDIEFMKKYFNINLDL